MVICVGIEEAFSKPVDEDTRIGVFQLNFVVTAVMMIDGQEHVAHRVFSSAGTPSSRAVARVLVVRLSVQQMVAYDRMDFGSTKESAVSFERSEPPYGGGAPDCYVNTNLDSRKDSHDDTCEKDDDL